MSHIFILINIGFHRRATVQKGLAFAEAIEDSVVHLACDAVSANPFSKFSGNEALDLPRAWDALEEARQVFVQAQIPVSARLCSGDLLEAIRLGAMLYTLAVIAQPVSERVVKTLVDDLGISVVLVGREDTLIVSDKTEWAGTAAPQMRA